MNKKILAVLMTLMLFSNGCAFFEWLFPSDSTNNTSQNLDKSSDIIFQEITNLEGIEKNITDKATEIKDRSAEAKGVIPEGSKAIPLLDNIGKGADAIIIQTEKLGNATNNLRGANKKIKKASSEVDVLNSRIKRLEEEKESGLRKILLWLVAGSIVVGAVAFVSAFYTGSTKLGLLIAGCSFTVTIISMMLWRILEYLKYIAIGGGVLFVLAIAWFIYQLFVQRKAIVENILTQEFAKKEMPVETRLIVYGNKDQPGQVERIQSPTTKKIVKGIKDKIPKTWDIMRKKTREKD